MFLEIPTSRPPLESEEVEVAILLWIIKRVTVPQMAIVKSISLSKRDLNSIVTNLAKI